MVKQNNNNNKRFECGRGDLCGMHSVVENVYLKIYRCYLAGFGNRLVDLLFQEKVYTLNNKTAQFSFK